ncbi:MAG: TonB-dependent receptor [Armatimonadota bacterium]|nr:TonB-dependent receptor [Armatimonadota bacterium]
MFFAIVFTVLICVVTGLARGESAAPPQDLTQLSIEELMQVEVVTASKKAQAIWEVPASVFVVTAEDIQRFGVNTIPEALRLVPGVHVAQQDSNKWAVAVRGFNGRYSNKLLVLIDGRVVYTPLFSGVYWDAQPPLFLEDIERIEVIRGPGATLWGANAVNGVINIITKSARHTQGTLLVSGGGGTERAFGGLRVGGTLGADAYYRVYALYTGRDRLKQDEVYIPNHDDWQVRRGGFRVEWNRSAEERWTLHGEAYTGRVGQRLRIPDFASGGTRVVDDRYTTTGYYLMGTWNRERENRTDTLHLYFDHYSRSPLELTEFRDTVNLSWQQRLLLGDRHDLLWGIEYKLTADKTRGRIIRLNPPSKTDHIFSMFAQDDIRLNERLRLTLGTKFENNSYTAWEVQPNLRLLWKPNERTVWWGAVSRAVRMPTRVERAVELDAYYEGEVQGLPLFSRLYGSPLFRSEEVTSYELGYRSHPHERVSLEISAFYNVYRHLRSFEPADVFPELEPAPHLIVPVYMSNKLHGRTYGWELSLRWNPTDWWSLQFGYANLTYRLQHEPDSRDPFKLHSDSTSNTPRHQWNLSSHWNLPRGWRIDAYLFFVDRLFGMDFLPSYYRLDVCIGWRPSQEVELSLMLQNLLRRDIREFEHPLWERDSIPERTVYGRLSWRFR